MCGHAGAAHQQPRYPVQPGRGRPVLGIGITAALRPRPLPATVRGTSLLGRRTMLAVGPPLHWHRDGASQQFVSAGLAPPVADQKGVYLGDWGVCQTPRACANPPLPFRGRPAPCQPTCPFHLCPLPLALVRGFLVPRSPSISLQSRIFSQTPLCTSRRSTGVSYLLSLVSL